MDIRYGVNRMDRLISENLILSLFDGKVEQELPTFSKTMTKIIKSLPPAEPYKGMTNGEVIKILFPQGEIVKGVYGISGNPLVCVNLSISTECSEMVFTEDWWNSPYKVERSE